VRRRVLLGDFASAIIAAALVLIVAPGVAVAGIIALLVLAAVRSSVVIERRDRRSA